MAVKNLKMVFREPLLTLTYHILICVKCKSVSVMTGLLFFLLQPKLFWLVVLSANYLLYDINATRIQK